jgi:hypothetical protein
LNERQKPAATPAFLLEWKFNRRPANRRDPYAAPIIEKGSARGLPRRKSQQRTVVVIGPRFLAGTTS